MKSVCIPRLNALAAMRTPGPASFCFALVACLATGTAHSKITIEIPDTTPAIATNVREFLSLTRYAERTDVTPEVMSRLQRRIGGEAKRALEPLGYYEPTITYDTVRNGDDWKVTIHVDPGRPVRLSEVSVTAIGPGKDERALRTVLESKVLKPGLRLNHGTYDSFRDALIRAARSEGYLDAHMTKKELLIDREERRATVTLEIDTQERYRFGAITTEQSVITDDAMHRLLRMKEGDPYTLDRLVRTQYILDDTQYFKTADIESGDPDRTAHTVPVKITADANRRHRYGASLGYATDTRARGQFTWDNRRVNERGHRSKVELTASSVLNEITGRYAIPVMDVALEKLEFSAGLHDEELGDSTSKRAEIGAGLTQVQGRWQRVVFLTLSQEESLYPANSTQPDTDTFLIIPGISYSTLPSYIVGGPARTYNIYSELRGSPATLGSDESFLQFRSHVERIYTLSEKWTLRGRFELGASWVDDFSDLPASQRFFAGGDRSVRGFGLNSLSPTDSAGNTIGGKNIVTGTIEFERLLPKNFGVAVFSDFGNAFDHWDTPDLQYSAGLGVRFHIAIASLGIDVAQALSVNQDPRVHLYMSTTF